MRAYFCDNCGNVVDDTGDSNLKITYSDGSKDEMWLCPECTNKARSFFNRKLTKASLSEKLREYDRITSIQKDLKTMEAGREDV